MDFSNRAYDLIKTMDNHCPADQMVNLLNQMEFTHFLTNLPVEIVFLTACLGLVSFLVKLGDLKLKELRFELDKEMLK